MNKLRIGFVWYFNKASSILDNWRDGLRSAIELVGQKHRVDWYIDEVCPKDDYDWVIVWTDAQSEFLDKPYKAKRGIFLTAMPQDYSKLRGLDIVFCESQPILEAVRAQGIRAVKAFGTDTDFFKPQKVEKDIDFFYPATFSPWKKQSEIAYLGKQLTCIGTVQPDGALELAKCKENGVNIEIGYFPVEKIRDYYNRSRNVILPAVHGSERTCLEAMACDIKPIVTHPLENPKLNSYLEELDASGLSPRDFVVKNYSHKVYADTILRIIEE